MNGASSEIMIFASFCTIKEINYALDYIEHDLGRKIVMGDLGMVVQSVQHSIIKENAWDISKHGIVNFKRLKRLIGERVSMISRARINGKVKK